MDLSPRVSDEDAGRGVEERGRSEGDQHRRSGYVTLSKDEVMVLARAMKG